MKKWLTLALLCAATFLPTDNEAFAPKREYYEIRIYRFKTREQESRTEKFLKDAFVPAAHRFGISKLGVFKPVETDTTAGKRMYVLIPYSTSDQIIAFSAALKKDKQFLAAGTDYLEATFDNPPYERMETVQLIAFEGMVQSEVPKLTTSPGERIYELRSYESATEKLFKNKVQMFNQGNEIALFKRLEFNAVFYGEVTSGSHMPNLMYMTSFSNMASRDEHWKTFVADPEWKKLSSLPEYQHNVSHINIYLLHSTDYSDF